MSSTFLHDESKRRASLSVGVIDDRVIVREGLRVLLQGSANTRLEWISSSLSDAFSEAPKVPIDALFVSVDLGGHSFQAAASSLRRAFGQAQLIGVVVDPTGWAARVGDRNLVDDQLMVDEIHPAWPKALKVDVAGDDPVERLASDASITRRLSTREREVLSLLIRARGNRSIAQSLGIAEATVKRHVSSILTKFGSQSRAEAALAARQLGYTSD